MDDLEELSNDDFLKLRDEAATLEPPEEPVSTPAQKSLKDVPSDEFMRLRQQAADQSESVLAPVRAQVAKDYPSTPVRMAQAISFPRDLITGYIYGKAKNRLSEGNASEQDLRDIAIYEQEHQRRAESKKSIGGFLAGTAMELPSQLAGFEVGGIATRAAAPALGIAGAGAAPAIGRAALTTLATPNVGAQTIIQKNIEAGRDPLDMRGVASGTALGTAQMLTLGLVGKLTGKIAPEAGQIGQMAIQGVTGPIAQGVTDIVTSSMGLDAGFGTMGQLLSGNFGEAARHAMSQAMTFASLGGLHANPEAGKRIAEAIAESLKSARKSGLSVEAASRKAAEPVVKLEELMRNYEEDFAKQRDYLRSELRSENKKLAKEIEFDGIANAFEAAADVQKAIDSFKGPEKKVAEAAAEVAMSGGPTLGEGQELGEGIRRFPVLSEGKDIGGMIVTEKGKTLDLTFSADNPEEVGVGSWKGMVRQLVEHYPDATHVEFKRTTGPNKGKLQRRAIPNRKLSTPAQEDPLAELAAKYGLEKPAVAPESPQTSPAEATVATPNAPEANVALPEAFKDATKEDLLGTAKMLGVKVRSEWSRDRIANEIGKSFQAKPGQVRQPEVSTPAQKTNSDEALRVFSEAVKAEFPDAEIREGEPGRIQAGFEDGKPVVYVDKNHLSGDLDRVRADGQEEGVHLRHHAERGVPKQSDWWKTDPELQDALVSLHHAFRGDDSWQKVAEVDRMVAQLRSGGHISEWHNPGTRQAAEKVERMLRSGRRWDRRSDEQKVLDYFVFLGESEADARKVLADEIGRLKNASYDDAYAELEEGWSDDPAARAAMSRLIGLGQKAKPAQRPVVSAPAQPPRETTEVAPRTPEVVHMRDASKTEILDRIDRDEGGLDANEKQVIAERLIFGRSHAEIGEDIGLTRQRVEQIEKKALKKLGYSGSVNDYHAANKGNNPLAEIEQGKNIGVDQLHLVDPDGSLHNARIRELDAIDQKISDLLGKKAKEKKRGKLTAEREAYYRQEYERLRTLAGEGQAPTQELAKESGEDSEIQAVIDRDRETKQARIDLYEEAFQALKEFGLTPKKLAATIQRGKTDPATLRGMDEVANDLNERYSFAKADENPSDALARILSEGKPKPISKEEAKEILDAEKVAAEEALPTQGDQGKEYGATDVGDFDPSEFGAPLTEAERGPGYGTPKSVGGVPGMPYTEAEREPMRVSWADLRDRKDGAYEGTPEEAVQYMMKAWPDTGEKRTVVIRQGEAGEEGSDVYHLVGEKGKPIKVDGETEGYRHEVTLRDGQGKELAKYTVEIGGKATGLPYDREVHQHVRVTKTQQFGAPLTGSELGPGPGDPTSVGGIPGIPYTEARQVTQEPNQRVTALARAVQEKEREALGFSKLTPPERVRSEKTLHDAVAKIQLDPMAGDRLFKELEANPREATLEDLALLLAHKVALSNEMDRAVLSFGRLGQPGINSEAARARSADLLDELNRLHSVIDTVRTQKGRELAFFRQLIAEDYSPAGMLAQAAAAKGSKLTEAETDRVVKLSEEIRRLQQELEAAKEKPTVAEGEKGDMADLRIAVKKGKRAWDDLRGELKGQNRTPIEKAFHGTKETLNAARSLMTSMDFSSTLRQGGFLSFGHPLKAAKAIPDMIRAFGSERAADRAQDTLEQRPNFVKYKQAGLFLADKDAGPSKQEEAYVGKWVKKIPGIAGSERAYNTFLNRLRADVFDALSRGAQPEEAKELARFVNIATGRGELGSLENAASGLAQIFFSPKYVWSRFQLLAGAPLWGGSAKTRALIASEYARTLIGIGTFYALMKAANDDAKITFDPRSSDFGKVQLGKTRIDPLTGLGQVAVFLSRLGSGQTKTVAGKVSPIRGDKVPYGGSTVQDVISTFVRSKLAPAPGAAIDVLAGKNVVGEKTTPLKTAGNLATPIAARDVYDALKDQGVPRGVAVGLLAILGMSTAVYERRK